MKYWTPLNIGLALFGAAYLVYIFSQTILVQPDLVPVDLGQIETTRQPQASVPSPLPAARSESRPRVPSQVEERRKAPLASDPNALDRPAPSLPPSGGRNRPSAITRIGPADPLVSPRRETDQPQDRPRPDASENRSRAARPNRRDDQDPGDFGGIRLPPGAVGATKRSPSNSDQRDGPRPPRPRSSMSN